MYVVFLQRADVSFHIAIRRSLNYPHHMKTYRQRFSTRSDSNQPAQLQKLARILKLWI